MVLFRRNPVEYAGDDVHKVPLNALVWEIQETREVFADYEAYLKRLGFYEQPQFTCELTGRQNLPFKVAHQSEVLGSTGIDNSFPEALKEPLLRKLHLNADGRLEHLVDLAFEAFKMQYFPGEQLIYTEPHTARRFAAYVREKTMFAELVFPDGRIRPTTARYTVELENFYPGKTNTLTIDESTLSRERGTFTKAILKSFIKNAFRKDTWVGAPWVVRSHYAERYNIDTTIPPHLQKGSKAYLVAQQARQTKAKKPAESLAQSDEQNGHGEADDLLLPTSKSKRPPLNAIEITLAPVFEQFLEVWGFFNVFNEILILDAFTLDDFGDALQYEGPSEMIDELFCSLLVALGENNASELATLLAQPESLQQEPDQRIGEIQAQGILTPAREALVYACGPWKHKLSQQSFHDDGYIEVLVGLCCEISKSQPHGVCGDIVRHLAEADGELPACFRSLVCTMKVGLLSVFMEMLWQTALIRDYMEECSKTLTNVRKDRIEANRIKRSLMDDIYKLRLGMRAQYPLKKSVAGAEAAAALLDEKLHGSQSASASVASEDASDEEMEDEDDAASIDSDESPIRTARRQSGRISGSKLKNVLSQADLESESSLSEVEDETEGQNHEQKHYASRAEYEADIKRIQRKVTRQNDKLATLDADFRESDMQRLKSLGQDRFCNTYWFLEAVGMPYKGMPSQSTSHAGYAAGRVFLQGPHVFARRYLADLLPSESLQKRKGLELPLEDVSKLQETSQWACYDQPEQLERLHTWLSPQGEREGKLRHSLEARFGIISESMEARARYLTSETRQAAERRSLRHSESQIGEHAPRFASWRNTMALHVNGRIHSAPVMQKGKAVSKKRRR